MLTLKNYSRSLGALVVSSNKKSTPSKEAFDPSTNQLLRDFMAISKLVIFKNLSWELKVEILAVVFFLNLQFSLLQSAVLANHPWGSLSYNFIINYYLIPYLM